MSLSIIILFALLGLITMFIYSCILLGRKRWNLGILVLSLPVIAIAAAICLYWYAFHTTKPSSLDFTIKQDPAHQYVLSGKWNERIDYYSFGTDFVAMCTKDNKKITMTEYTKGDWQKNYYNFQSDIPLQINKFKQVPEGCHLQLFDIKSQKEFSLKFKVNNQKQKEPLTIYYVHVRIDPMDAPAYWVKKLTY